MKTLVEDIALGSVTGRHGMFIDLLAISKMASKTFKPEKMAILQTASFNFTHFLKEPYYILTLISLKFVPNANSPKQNSLLLVV